MQRDALLCVLAEVRALVALTGNDFSWSSWADGEAACHELYGLVRRVEAFEFPSALCVIFAPTGPLQELAIASGWGNESPALAERFDRARAG